MKWIEYEMISLMNELFKLPPPFMIHGDTAKNQRFCYPTHTHGLSELDLPEIFINASCFGPIDNARLINEIAAALLINTVAKESFFHIEKLEMETGLHEKDDMVIGLRKVSNDFSGVKAAYNDDTPSKFGYAQLYFVGDDHVLLDEYFTTIIERHKSCPPIDEH